MSAGAHKNTLIFAGGFTNFASALLRRSQSLLSHPPASSPIKKPGVEDLRK
jgi:hypothetical protein